MGVWALFIASVGAMAVGAVWSDSPAAWVIAVCGAIGFAIAGDLSDGTR